MQDPFFQRISESKLNGTYKLRLHSFPPLIFKTLFFVSCSKKTIFIDVSVTRERLQTIENVAIFFIQPFKLTTEGHVAINMWTDYVLF